MRLLIVVVVLPVFCFAQTKEKPSFRRHFIEISPLAVTMKKGVSYNHHLEYRFLMTRNLYLNAATTLTLFKQMDYSRRNHEFGIMPLFNESSVSAGYWHSFNELTEENRKINSIGADMGYHYMQYSPNPNSRDYDITDSLENGFRRLGGYKIHSLEAGVSFQHVIYNNEQIRPSIKFRHFLSISYLFGIHFQQPTYILISPASAMKSENLEGNSWKSRNGFRVEYTFEHSVGKRTGLLYGFNFTCAPWPDYKPNYNYFVPRGGELIYPTALTFRAGITIQ